MSLQDELKLATAETMKTLFGTDVTTKDADGKPTNKFREALIFGAAIKDLPPPTWLIPGYLERDTTAMLYGPSGAYKASWRSTGACN